jgi:uncharacterized repeat protein (TIGR03803 family)
MYRPYLFGAVTLCLCSILAPTMAAASSYSTLYAITGTGDGASPEAAMTDVGGTLYGTTPYGGATGNGTIFKFDPSSGTETVLYSFAGGSDAAVPVAGLINVGGTLYGTTEYGGENGGQNDGTIFKFDPVTGTETVVTNFCCNGSGPTAPLVDVGGILYGTTLSTNNGQGTVFAINPANGAISFLYSFPSGSTPYGGLIGVGGLLYGTTEYGGTHGDGTLFSIDPSSGTETVLYNFMGGVDGANPAATLIDVKGVLFGTTQYGGAAGDGTVFKFTISSGTEKVVYGFTGGSDGATPFAPLCELGGTLYGTTEYGGSGDEGTVFSLNPKTGAEKVVHSFDYGNDPELPVAGLTSLDGLLYGGSTFGGSNGQGALFSVDPTSGAATQLHSFTGSTPVELGGLVNLSGKLAVTSSDGGGTGNGTVVTINPANRAATTLFTFTGLGTGVGPLAPLLKTASALYGTTVSGGAGCNGSGCGTVFSLNPTTGAETLLHEFGSGSGSDGASPWSGVIDVKGTLYGTTQAGGSNGLGTVYRVNLKTGAERIVYNFAGGNDGQLPFLGNLLDVGGTLYGMTFFGGSGGAGTIFKLDPTTGVETVLHGFTGGADGGYPYGGLIKLGTELYGATFYGGASGEGTVFEVDPTTGAETVLYNFLGGSNDGAGPGASLVESGGQLYGTTWYGGVIGSGCGGFQCGTVFSVNPATGAESVLHFFQGGSDGGNPSAPLIAIKGTLYGSTGSAGSGGLGTVFALKP